MKLRIVLVAMVGALGLLAVGTVSASRSKVRTLHFPTAIFHDADALLSNGQSVISGHLRTRLVCRIFRQVKVKAHYPDGRVRYLDADLTSFNGAWAVKADINGVDRLKAKVSRRVNTRFHVAAPVGDTHRRSARMKAHRRVVCEAASVIWRPDADALEAAGLRE
jgi:hypothetical protein